MRIAFDRDIFMGCAGCGSEATQREVDVSRGKHSRRVPFQTHGHSLHDDEQAAAFGRMVEFYSRFFDLLDDLQSVRAEDCRLTHGRLIDLDLGAVMPSACARRTEIIPLATVRVAGLVHPIELAARPIQGATVESLLVELKAAAEPIAATLNAQYEARDF